MECNNCFNMVGTQAAFEHGEEWVDCRQLGMNGKQLNKFLVFEAGLAMNAGTYFGKNGEDFMRTNVVCPRVILEKALVQLKDALK